MINVNTLPDDPVSLKELLIKTSDKLDKQQNQIEQFQKKEQEYHSNIECLTEEVRLLRYKLFGRKSEKLRPDKDPNQPDLFDELETIEAEEKEAEPEPTTQIKSYTRKKSHRMKIPASIPRKEIIHDIPEEEKVCACGCKMEKIGEEISEKLDYIPAQFLAERHIRPKYACKACEGSGSEGIHPAVRTAPPAPAMIPKSNATPGLLAHLITAKYEDALPFYRQEKIFARQGLELPRSTMCRWVRKVYERIVPLLNLMFQDQKSGSLIGIDETTVQVLNEPGKSNTSNSYMWVSRGGPPEINVVRFKYDPGRGSKVAKEILDGFSGVVQSDGYAGYKFIEKSEGLHHAGCWAHVRREFNDIIKSSKKSIAAKMALNKIKGLYKIEEEARKEELSPEELCALRKKKSRPIADDFFIWIEKKSLQINPSGPMGKAIGYALKIKQSLLLFLDNGIIPIDNNLVENAIRPFAIGRKNWLFSGSPHGAEASAGLYSLIETAKQADLHSYWYLRYLFEQLPTTQEDELRKLLPYNLSKKVLAEYFAERLKN